MKAHCLILSIFLYISVNSFAGQTINGSFMFQGITRTYSFYVPSSYNAANPIPMVFDLHGYTSSGAQEALYTDFKSIADTAYFIVVHPDGTYDASHERHWNTGLLGDTVDDIGFLENLIDTISAHYNINQSRIYICGLSNGAIMSYYLAYKTNSFAAIASVAGTMTIPMYNNCNPTHPIPIMEIHGTDDPIVPYNGNAVEKGVQDVVELWVQLNHCDTTPTITPVPNINSTDSSTAVHYVYSDGTDGNTVELYKIVGGGHTWPDGTVQLPVSTYGHTCMDFSASKEIWRFFSQFSRPLGIKNESSKDISNVTVFPNPTRKGISIQFSKVTKKPYLICLYNMQGKRVIEQTGNRKVVYLMLNNIKSGAYILNIKCQNLIFSKKILISR